MQKRQYTFFCLIRKVLGYEGYHLHVFDDGIIDDPRNVPILGFDELENVLIAKHILASFWEIESLIEQVIVKRIVILDSGGFGVGFYRAVVLFQHFVGGLDIFWLGYFVDIVQKCYGSDDIPDEGILIVLGEPLHQIEYDGHRVRVGCCLLLWDVVLPLIFRVGEFPLTFVDVHFAEHAQCQQRAQKTLWVVVLALLGVLCLVEKFDQFDHVECGVVWLFQHLPKDLILALLDFHLLSDEATLLQYALQGVLEALFTWVRIHILYKILFNVW